ncbi:hypothetical protein [Azospirillum sp.]|uniref:hypothetical protein n=1 Tax=Azospirillum sp. TaxID=34012 RepID=UPI002D6F47A7|nr:hypothetical protein [Azospirillum sp.]HYD69515.1 hypothetical protein [Azospirillum sp.]
MKAFLSAVVFVLILAVVAGVALDRVFSEQADDAFATSSARVGEGGAIETRKFSGQ